MTGLSTKTRAGGATARRCRHAGGNEQFAVVASGHAHDRDRGLVRFDNSNFDLTIKVRTT